MCCAGACACVCMRVCVCVCVWRADQSTGCLLKAPDVWRWLVNSAEVSRPAQMAPSAPPQPFVHVLSLCGKCRNRF